MRLLERDELALVEREERLVQRLHPVLVLPDLHLGVDLMDLVLADQVSDRRRSGSSPRSRCTRPAPHARDQLLADDALEHERELRADLILLVRREDVDDAVDRGDGAVRVERGEDEVTRLADGERGLDGLEVAHLADEHDVRVLPEDVLERGLEALGVRADLALVHDRELVRVQVLDRILDRDDVAALLGVDLVDDRRERRALAGARRAR